MDVSCLLLQPTPISPFPRGGGPDPDSYYNYNHDDPFDYNYRGREGLHGGSTVPGPEHDYYPQDPGFLTATTETVTMAPHAPAVRTESPTTSTTPPPAMDATLPFDPSFVDIAHPGQPPAPPPKDYRLKTRTNSKSSSSSSSSDGKTTPAAMLDNARAGRPKQRSVSTPVPKTSTTSSTATGTTTTITTASTSNGRSSSKSRHHHRSTKSHSNKDDGDVIVDLVKELRAAKKRERAGSLSLSLGLGGMKSLFSGIGGAGAAQDHEAKSTVPPVDRAPHPQPYYPRDPQSQSVPIPPPPPEPQQHSSVQQQPPTSDVIANAVKASLAMVENAPTKKKRGRSASSASALPHSKSSSASSVSSTTDSIVLLVQHLQHETARANAAEAQRRELLDKLRGIMKEKVELEARLGMVKEELGLYKVQLDLAQKEILKAQEVVESVDRQRILAEKEAARNRERVRRLVEDQLVQEALEAGRREGYNEGMRRGKEARQREEEHQRRLVAAREQERREREERAARIAAEERRKEQEKAQRERERLGRRARSNTVGTVQDAAAAARARSTTPFLPIPPRPPTAGPSNWRSTPLQPPARPSTAAPQGWPHLSQAKESDKPNAEHIPDAGHFASLLPLPTLVTPAPVEVPPTQPQPPSAINTMHPQPQQRQSSQSSSSSSSSQRLRHRPGAEEGGHRHALATTARAQHSSGKGQHLGHTPTAESERHPHYDKVVHPPYVPPPDNFIPAMNADGSLSVPPPHELNRRPVSMVAEEEEDDGDDGVTDYFGESAVVSTPIRTRGRTYSVGSSNFAGPDEERFEVANPVREMARMRMKMDVGDGETPTPAPSRGLPHHHHAKDKGKMRLMNPDSESAPIHEPRPGSRAGEKQRERDGWDITRPPTTAPIPPPRPTTPDFSRKPDRPPSRTQGQRDIYGKPNGSPPRWESLEAPPRGPYGALRQGSTSNSSTPPERAPMIRSMTSGTTPEIGVEPPSQSPTTVEENTFIDPVMLTPDPAAQLHSSNFAPPGTPRSAQNRLNHPTSDLGSGAQVEPVYGRPQLDVHEPKHPYSSNNDVRVGYFAAPPFPSSPFELGSGSGSRYEGGSGGFQIYGSTHAGSAPRQGFPNSNHDDGWFPPPPIPLSPIPAATNIRSEGQVYGKPGGDERAKYISPPPLNRPISLFDDSE